MPAGRRHQPQATGRLITVELDEESLLGPGGFPELERAAAVADLLAENLFSPQGRSGTFHLRLAVIERKLVLDIADSGGTPVARHMLALSPLVKVVRDYHLVCESHREALRGAPPGRVEAIDMGRRALHDEGAGILQERLSGRVEVDFATARRLFTLVAALAWKG